MSNMDPRIGILMREGKRVFYAYPSGYREAPVEGSLAKVLASLQALDGSLPGAPQGDRLAPRSTRIHAYVVTVQPLFTVYSGTATLGTYEVTVNAPNAREACRSVRRDRRLEEGRFAVPAQFRARRLAD